MVPIIAPLSLKSMIPTLCDFHVVLGDLGVSLKIQISHCLLWRLQMKNRQTDSLSKINSIAQNSCRLLAIAGAGQRVGLSSVSVVLHFLCVSVGLDWFSKRRGLWVSICSHVSLAKSNICYF